jgi:amphi-Trp domain-containing protein
MSKAAKNAKSEKHKGAEKGSENQSPSAVDAGAARQHGSSKIKFDSILPREEAVSYFEALIAGMKKGTIQLRKGEESVTLKPTARVAVEVRASKKADTEKISFEIVWKKSAESDLKITTG